MKKITLNDGNQMPVISFGTFQITDFKECERAVLDALAVGFRAIDTAQSYMNEQAVGNALAKTEVKREEIFLTTKIWLSNYGYEQTIASFKRSLERLQTPYVDLVLLHQPFGEYRESFKALVSLKEQGLIKSIGVSNFYDDKLVDLCLFNDYGVVPAVNQIEVNPFFQRINSIEVNKKYNVTPQAWAPFGEGKNNIFENEILNTIAKAHNKSVAQVILRWLYQREVPFITKSVNKNRMEENFNIFDFELTSQEMNEILSLDQKESLFFDHTSAKGVEWIHSLIAQRG
ncbi:aldo/keto reductase [Spiroplasma chinense]|uniref:Aldo/keto reductase n=1 Tax=Spiroplasma chinense TaxID=216932 RepID=A0A5B9Y5D3_9MOLU|nr:aldo/keto reductase [Spiroplasma chinense]QEH61242.1 aldo/keto reductase [Spiroplasma chinense]